MGNPHMFLAAQKWRDEIEGMLPTDPDRDQTTVDIEPFTGKGTYTTQ